MTDQEKAQQLLDKARRKLAGYEIDLLEKTVNGDELTKQESLWFRTMETELAEYLQ